MLARTTIMGLLVWMLLTAAAAAEVQVHAQVDRTRIVEGESLRLTVVIEASKRMPYRISMSCPGVRAPACR